MPPGSVGSSDSPELRGGLVVYRAVIDLDVEAQQLATAYLLKGNGRAVEVRV